MEWASQGGGGVTTPGCSRNAKSQPKAVIEDLVGREDHPKAAQVYAMYLSDEKGWSQDPPLSRPHLRVANGIKGISLQNSAYLRPPKGE